MLGNYGLDVARALDIIVPDMTEGCVCYLMDRAMLVFGMSNNPVRAKNSDARAAIRLIRSAIKTLKRVTN